MLRDKLTADCAGESIDKKVSADTEDAYEACYEKLASQEEIYREEVEEEIHVKLDSYH